MRKFDVVYVEGLPGSGKTTLLNGLGAQFAGLHIVGEYADPVAADEAISVDDESYFLKNDERKYRTARTVGGLTLVDRGHLSTVLYNEGHEMVMGERTVDTGSWYKETILRKGMLPDAYILLETPPGTTFSRRPPTTDWDNMWDKREVLEYAVDPVTGYLGYMGMYERDVPVLTIQADHLGVEEVQDKALEFLADSLPGMRV